MLKLIMIGLNINPHIIIVKNIIDIKLHSGFLFGVTQCLSSTVFYVSCVPCVDLLPEEYKIGHYVRFHRRCPKNFQSFRTQKI